MNKELIYRIISSLILIPFILYAIWAGGVAFYALLLVGFLIILKEWFRMVFLIEYQKWAIGFAGIVYFSYAVFALYELESLNEPHNFNLFVLFVSVWISDIFAYISGKIIKGPKIVEKISPKKTWAGFVGAILFPTIFFVTLGLVGLYTMNVFELIIIGVCIGLASQLGDFLISTIKRRAGVKDTGTLIPGHGGLLDRVDSLIMAAPIFFSLIRGLS